MAIIGGTRIKAIDFTSIVGNHASNMAFPNSLSATNALNALYGVGYGDRGLGQVPYTYTGSGNGTQTIFDIGITTSLKSLTASELTTVNNVTTSQPIAIKGIYGSLVELKSAPATGTTVKIYVHIFVPTVADMIYASTWKNMRKSVYDLNTFLGLSVDNIPAPSNYDVNNNIIAFPYQWQTTVRLIDQKRKTIPLTSLLAPTNKITQQRTTPWPDLVKCIFQVDFQDEDHARYFFNSGGYITVSPSFTPTDSNDTHSASWRTLLNGSNPTSNKSAGSFSIKAESSSRTGSGGNFQSDSGYFTLSTQRTQIQEFSVGNLDSNLIDNTGIYKDYVANYYTASVYVSNVSGVNGGNGKTLVVELLFNDVYGSPYQPVTGTLTVNVTMTKADMLTIADPTFMVTTNLSDGGGDIYYPFATEITANKYNYNLLTEAMAAGYTNYLTLPLKAVITIRENIVVGSNSNAAYAMTIPALQAGSQVTLRNYGYIVGKGGNGGNGTAHTAGGNGTAGGPALLLQYNCLLENYGLIGGGGGGGGGATATNNPLTQDDPGGGGGGGAGWDLGNGADGQPFYGTYAGQNSTFTEGGIGGTPSAHGGSGEWYLAGDGGRGGSLGQAGNPGQNGKNNDGFGSGQGGVAGNAIVGNTFVTQDSNLGTIRGNIV